MASILKNLLKQNPHASLERSTTSESGWVAQQAFDNILHDLQLSWHQQRPSYNSTRAVHETIQDMRLYPIVLKDPLQVWCHAIRRGDTAKAQEYLQTWFSSGQELPEHLYTASTLLDLPLYAALDVGDTKMVQQLLAHGMRVDDFQDVVGHQIAVGSMQKGQPCDALWLWACQRHNNPALALLWLSSHHPAKDFAPTWEKFSHAQQQHAILEATLRDWRTCATPGTQMRVASDQLPLPSYTPTLSLESVDMTPTML